MKVGVGWERVPVPRSEGYANKPAKSAKEIGGKVQIEAQLQSRQPKTLLLVGALVSLGSVLVHHVFIMDCEHHSIHLILKCYWS